MGSVPFTAPTVDDFKGQFWRDFPFAVPAYGATATSVIHAGVVTSVEVTAAGYKYAPAPIVTLGAPPAGGTQATAEATVDSAGQVTGITVTDPGTGYVAAPLVTITPAPGDGDDTNTDQVQDRDITNALQKAGMNFAPGLFADQADFTVAYCLLAAHYLCVALQASFKGVMGSSQWYVTGKSVAELSEQFGVPPRVMNSPWLSAITKTTYGMEYISIIAPRMVGNVVAIRGGGGAFL